MRMLVNEVLKVFDWGGMPLRRNVNEIERSLKPESTMEPCNKNDSGISYYQRMVMYPTYCYLFLLQILVLFFLGTVATNH